MQCCAAARGSGNYACADGSCSHTPCVIVALQTRCSERRLQNALPRVQLMLDRHCCLQKLRGWRTGTGALPNLPVYVAKSCDLAFRSLPPHCPRRSLRTLRSCRCCPWIALLDDPSAIGLTGPLLLNTDQRLPEAIFMQQQSSAAFRQAAEPDLETSREDVKNPICSYFHAARAPRFAAYRAVPLRNSARELLPATPATSRCRFRHSFLLNGSSNRAAPPSSEQPPRRAQRRNDGHEINSNRPREVHRQRSKGNLPGR